MPKSVPVETWILALGGVGIVVGLATYGYLIMRVLGVKVVKLSNARGFCAELSTAITVVLASRFGKDEPQAHAELAEDTPLLMLQK